VTAPDILQAIVAATRARVRASKTTRPERDLERAALAIAAPKGFRTALQKPGLNVIAECKRRSPSRGVLRWGYDAVAIARSYAIAGASALSVLTEPAFFDGELAHLEAVRAGVELPLLRKDFIIDPYQVIESRAAGADAILLIVAALEDADLAGLHERAVALGMDVLVEVHDEAELTRAVDVGARLIGVNNRNLRTLTVDVDASARLAAKLPRDVVAVAESGLKTIDDLERLRELGFGAFLIGERFMTAPDPGEALRMMLTTRGAHA
jgi:indole-3-glycerol phosphate synthase